uniref:Eukaryotic translation initiation factor 3 subunit F n=1 Tax=Lepeophtheirus salmonis TaxID=72036 RepID=D3PI04_LEPSM|nr:Eukaryotic translation initiation factor 3 subunit F [Lepeophtheirus salmonis]
MQCKVSSSIHPLVLINILDAFDKKPHEQERVVGTLLGYFEKDVAVVTNSFQIPYKFNDDEAWLNYDYSNRVSKLQRKCNSNLKIVGWFVAGGEVTEHCKLAHEKFCQKINNPIFLYLDTREALNEKIEPKVYQHINIGFGTGGSKGQAFLPIKVKIMTSGIEKKSIEMMASDLLPDKQIRGIEDKDHSLYLSKLVTKLIPMVEELKDFVDSVVDNKEEMDCNLGRCISQLVYSLPQLQSQQTQQLIDASFKDLIMVSYLTKLTKSHVKLLNLT